jgi:hypothetical protein
MGQFFPSLIAAFRQSGEAGGSLSCSPLITASLICHCDGVTFATKAISTTIRFSPGIRDSFSFAHHLYYYQRSQIRAIIPGQFLSPHPRLFIRFMDHSQNRKNAIAIYLSKFRFSDNIKVAMRKHCDKRSE